MDATHAPREVGLAIPAPWIVAVEPAGALEHHALVVDGGSIVALVPSASVAASWAPRETVELTTHVLLPGLVNAHAHSAMPRKIKAAAQQPPASVSVQGLAWAQ